jgi:hypothetical protein
MKLWFGQHVLLNKQKNVFFFLRDGNINTRRIMTYLKVGKSEYSMPNRFHGIVKAGNTQKPVNDLSTIITGLGAAAAGTRDPSVGE